MFVSFESLPPTSRIWIFQANRSFSTQEVETVSTMLREFTDEWAVHGTPIGTSYSIQYNQFIILAADETQQSASGCSIDSSVRVLKSIEQLLAIELFNRDLVAFLADGRVQLIPLKNLKEKFAAGILNDESLTFNNLVNTKGDLEKGWAVPAGETWLQRYIPNPLAKVKSVS
jgi:hypothetical protein